MRIILILIIFLQNIATISFSQNLILNGNFEDVNICNEFHAPCSPEAWRLTSTLLPEYNYSHENHTAGIIVINSSVKNTRSYLQSRLSSKISKGKRYKLSMDICPRDIYINNIGIVFSDTIILNRENVLLKTKPDIEFENNKTLLQNKKGKAWLNLEKEFVANEDALYIVIGCFLNDNELISKYSKGKFKAYNDYFYYFDNICLIPIDTMYDSKTLEFNKDIVYSQNDRHPVSDGLFNSGEMKKNIYNNSILTLKSKTDTINLFNDLLFEFDSYTPSIYLVEKVDSIFKNTTNSIDSILVIGYTDKIGTDSYNDELSYNRAESVANYIITSKFIQKDKISIKGMGSRFPIDENSADSMLYKNRRVEIIKYYLK